MCGSNVGWLASGSNVKSIACSKLQRPFLLAPQRSGNTHRSCRTPEVPGRAAIHAQQQGGKLGSARRELADLSKASNGMWVSMLQPRLPISAIQPNQIACRGDHRYQPHTGKPQRD